MLRKLTGALLISLTVVVLIAVFWGGLSSTRTYVAVQERVFPDFQLTDPKGQTITRSSLRNQVHIVHIWASWCGICLKEHGLWMDLKAKNPQLSIVGVLYRDNPTAAMAVINAKGSPYRFLLQDLSGSLGVDLGLIGIPETYIIDKQGVIRFHHRGAISKRLFTEKMLPLIENLEK